MQVQTSFCSWVRQRRRGPRRPPADPAPRSTLGKAAFEQEAQHAEQLGQLAARCCGTERARRRRVTIADRSGRLAGPEIQRVRRTGIAMGGASRRACRMRPGAAPTAASRGGHGARSSAIDGRTPVTRSTHRASSAQAVFPGPKYQRHTADLGSTVGVQEGMAVTEERAEQVARDRTSPRSRGCSASDGRSRLAKSARSMAEVIGQLECDRAGGAGARPGRCRRPPSSELARRQPRRTLQDASRSLARHASPG